MDESRRDTGAEILRITTDIVQATDGALAAGPFANGESAAHAVEFTHVAGVFNPVENSDCELNNVVANGTGVPFSYNEQLNLVTSGLLVISGLVGEIRFPIGNSLAPITASLLQ